MAPTRCYEPRMINKSPRRWLIKLGALRVPGGVGRFTLADRKR